MNPENEDISAKLDRITRALGTISGEMEQLSRRVDRLQAGAATGPGAATPDGAGPPGPPEPPSPDDAHPGDLYRGDGYPGPGYPGNAYPGSTYPGSAYQGSAYPGSTYPGSAHPGPAYPAPGYAGPGRPQPAYPTPGRPGPVPGQVTGPGPLATASRWGVGAIIAVIGSGVLLLGVLFLLILAAEAGYFPPPARAAAAAVLALVLIGGGAALRMRGAGGRPVRADPGERDEGAGPASPGTTPGVATALVATGVVTALLDIAACTALYHWMHPVVAYVLAALVGAGGMVLARLWHSTLLAVLVVVGTVLLSLPIDPGVDYLWFVAVVTALAAALGTTLGVLLRLARSALPALPVVFITVVAVLDESIANNPLNSGSAFGALLLFALAAAVVAVVETVTDPPRVGASVPVVFTALPLLAVPAVPDLGPAGLAVLVVGVAYLVAAAGLEVAFGASKTTAGWTALLTQFGAVGLVLVALGGALLLPARGVMPLMLLAVTLVVVAAALLDRMWLRVLGLAGSVVVLMAFLLVGRPYLALVDPGRFPVVEWRDVLSAVTATLLGVALAWWGLRRSGRSDAMTLLLGGTGVAVLAISAVVVETGELVGRQSDSARGGFLGAHLVVTVLWVALAAWLVLRRGRAREVLVPIGFVLGGLAVLKLFVLDLGMLPGILRVVAFLVVGALLLGTAVAYRGFGRERGDGPDGARPGSAGTWGPGVPPDAPGAQYGGPQGGAPQYGGTHPGASEFGDGPRGSANHGADPRGWGPGPGDRGPGGLSEGTGPTPPRPRTS